eukprot:3396936-Prymnesium_polylepis.1
MGVGTADEQRVLLDDPEPRRRLPRPRHPPVPLVRTRNLHGVVRVGRDARRAREDVERGALRLQQPVGRAADFGDRRLRRRLLGRDVVPLLAQPLHLAAEVLEDKVGERHAREDPLGLAEQARVVWRVADNLSREGGGVVRARPTAG